MFSEICLFTPNRSQGVSGVFFCSSYRVGIGRFDNFELLRDLWGIYINDCSRAMFIRVILSDKYFIRAVG